MALRSFPLLATAISLADAMTCSDVDANSLTFSCCFSGERSGTPVMMLHGFPNFKMSWFPLMEYWENQSVPLFGMACDLRGYSPGAAPTNKGDYKYNKLKRDVWKLAKAGFGKGAKFHLLGHDHGAMLGWAVASEDDAKWQLLSFGALSVPHPAALSSALVGEDADEAQQVALNYFNQVSLEDSATRNDAALSNLFHYGGFPTAEAFQKALWWYYGAKKNGYMPMPPVVSDDLVNKYMPNVAMVYGVRAAIPMEETSQGTAVEPEAKKHVHVPTLFVCGELDPYILCTHPYVEQNKRYVQHGKYTSVNIACGHNLLSRSECVSDIAHLSALEAITQHVTSSKVTMV